MAKFSPGEITPPPPLYVVTPRGSTPSLQRSTTRHSSVLLVAPAAYNTLLVSQNLVTRQWCVVYTPPTTHTTTFSVRRRLHSDQALNLKSLGYFKCHVVGLQGSLGSYLCWTYRTSTQRLCVRGAPGPRFFEACPYLKIPPAKTFVTHADTCRKFFSHM